MQIVFQLADTALNPSRPIGDILGRPLTFYHGLGAPPARRASPTSSTASACPPPCHRLPRELSGGRKRQPARRAGRRASVILRRDHLRPRHRGRPGSVIDLLKELQRDLGLSYRLHQPRPLDRAPSATRSW